VWATTGILGMPPACTDEHARCFEICENQMMSLEFAYGSKISF